MNTSEGTQTIYGFQTRLKGYSNTTFNQVFEDKKDLIKFITTKDIIIKGSTFKMIGENDSEFIEVPDDKNAWNLRQLSIFELHLHKTKYA